MAKWILPKGWHVHGDPVRKEKSIEPDIDIVDKYLINSDPVEV